MQGIRYNEAKKEIRSVLLTYKEPVTLEEFLRVYKRLIGEALPYRNLGYTSDIDFLKSMPDVAHVSTNEIGRIVLCGIGDESSRHIQKLVRRQKCSKENNKLDKNLQRPFHIPAREWHPFVPGPLRAEIINLAKLFPDGVTLPTFILAYKRKFNKYLPLNNNKGLETLEYMINSVEELELKTVKREKRIFLKSFQKVPVLPQENNAIEVHKSGISAQIQKNFQQVLLKYPDGVKAVHFPSLYEEVTGLSFDLHELGYISLYDLVDALPEIFKRILDPVDGRTWILLSANSRKKFDDRRKRRIAKNLHLSRNDEEIIRPPSPLKLREPVPADGASPSLSFAEPELPQNVKGEIYIPVFVSSITSPSLFWFQLQLEDIRERLDTFENDIQSFYNSPKGIKYVMADKDVVKGAICIVQCPEDNYWYRAVIKTIPSAETVNVFFVDYGGRENIPRENLRYIREKYVDYPAAAFRAELGGVKPANAATWSIEAQDRFIELCGISTLMALIRPSIFYDGLFSISLCDTNGEDDVHFTDTLVREGYAMYRYVNQLNNDAVLSENASPKDNILSYSSANNPLCGGNPSCEKEDVTNVLAVNATLSYSVDEQPSELTMTTKHCSCKRYVKLLELCEDTEIHIINLKDTLYVTAGDLCNLLWRGENFFVLMERLKYKEINAAHVEVSKEDNSDLFEQCKWYKIPDFQNCESEISLLILYSLKWAFNILNIFGHPLPCPRLAIRHEIESFNPEDPIWKEFTEYESDDTEEDILLKQRLRKLNLYDLEIKYEAIEIERQKLLKGNNASTAQELKRIKHLQSFIKRRMKHIEAVCTQWKPLIRVILEDQPHFNGIKLNT